MGDEELYALARLVQAFDELGIRYALVGSLASSVHGMPRATRDFDLIADIRLTHVQPLTAVIGEEYYVDADAIIYAIRESACFSVIDTTSFFKLDIFVVGADRYRATELTRAGSASVHGIPIRVASAEDVILAKLAWYRSGGEVSDRQWRDVLEVITVQGQRLDLPYLRQTAADLGVTDLLERALSET